jgi:hypothetical protein
MTFMLVMSNFSPAFFAPLLNFSIMWDGLVTLGSYKF